MLASLFRKKKIFQKMPPKAEPPSQPPVVYKPLENDQILVSYIKARLPMIDGPLLEPLMKQLPIVDTFDRRLNPIEGGVVAYILGVEFVTLSSEDGKEVMRAMIQEIPESLRSSKARGALRRFMEEKLPVKDITSLMVCFVHIMQAIQRARMAKDLPRAAEILDWSLDILKENNADEIVQRELGWEQFGSKGWHTAYPEMHERFSLLENNPKDNPLNYIINKHDAPDPFILQVIKHPITTARELNSICGLKRLMKTIVAVTIIYSVGRYLVRRPQEDD